MLILFSSCEAFMVLPTDVWGLTYYVFSMPDPASESKNKKNQVSDGSQFSKYM